MRYQVKIWHTDAQRYVHHIDMEKVKLIKFCHKGPFHMHTYVVRLSTVEISAV